MTPETTFRILLWVLFVGVLLMRFYFIFRVRQAGERVMPDTKAIEREGKGLFVFRLASGFLMLGILLSYALNLLWLESFNISIPDWLRWVGFGCGLISILFWTWTQVTLGNYWSPQLQIRTEHHLVTSGPYAHIRHPMYTGMTRFGVGLALVSANWIFVGLVVLIIVGLVFRIPQEEKMLGEKFGEEYQAYRHHTGSLLPK